MTISEKIREARSKAGLTQQQLADKVGVSQQYIAHYESGKYYPKIQTLQKFADALEISMADLLGLYSAAADCEASDLERLIELLFEFVERVVKKGATPEEVKVLPEMARLLGELLPENAKLEASPLDRAKQALAEVMASYGWEDVKPIVLHLDTKELARTTARRRGADKQ